MLLNPDQIKALHLVKTWYRSNEMYFIINGSGGVGKTFLLSVIARELPVKPLFLAPTHESLLQLKEKIGKDSIYTFKTVHSALGLRPTTTEKEIKFDQVRFPSLWNEVKVCIIDEASMLSETILELLYLTKVRILFVGHSAQLPPVELDRKRNDLCESPVFARDYSRFTLTIPMRNTGKLWEFNEELEKNIYTKDYVPNSSFDIKKTQLTEFLFSKDTKEKLYNGELKVIPWTNSAVDTYNNNLRKILYGDAAKEKYLLEDRILLTAPVNVIENLEMYTENGIKNFLNSKMLDYLFSNTKGIIKKIEKVVVRLNNYLHIPCFKLLIQTEEELYSIFEPIYKEDTLKISHYYEQLAWTEKNKTKRESLYKLKHFIASCFSQVKHCYAITSHRSQGSSIKEVVVIYNDMLKNVNRVERAKCIYVGCSRAVENLYFYRGL